MFLSASIGNSPYRSYVLIKLSPTTFLFLSFYLATISLFFTFLLFQLCSTSHFYMLLSFFNLYMHGFVFIMKVPCEKTLNLNTSLLHFPWYGLISELSLLAKIKLSEYWDLNSHCYNVPAVAEWGFGMINIATLASESCWSSGCEQFCYL